MCDAPCANHATISEDDKTPMLALVCPARGRCNRAPARSRTAQQMNPGHGLELPSMSFNDECCRARDISAEERCFRGFETLAQGPVHPSAGRIICARHNNG